MPYATYENGIPSAADISSWTVAVGIDLQSGQLDPWGGNNALKIQNTDTLNGEHHASIGSVVTQSGTTYVILYLKGDASWFGIEWSTGDQVNLVLSDGSIESSFGNISVPSVQTVGDWLRVVIACTNTGTNTLKFFVDSNNGDDVFTPSNTTKYAIFVPIVAASDSSLYVPTTGTAFSPLSLPALDSFEADLYVLNQLYELLIQQKVSPPVYATLPGYYVSVTNGNNSAGFPGVINKSDGLTVANGEELRFQVIDSGGSVKTSLGTKSFSSGTHTVRIRKAVGASASSEITVTPTWVGGADNYFRVELTSSDTSVLNFQETYNFQLILWAGTSDETTIFEQQFTAGLKLT